VNQRPLILLEATLDLYPQDVNGAAVTGSPFWLGVKAEGLRMDENMEEVESTPTGSEYRVFEDLNADQSITVEQIWKVDGATFLDPRPARGSRYVMNIAWEDERTKKCHQRTYYGVQFRRNSKTSRGVMESINNQSFRAQYYVEEGH